MPTPPSREELLQGRLDRVTRLLHGVEQGDVRAVHRTRVASRRLRELLPLLQLGQDPTDRLGRRLRRLTRRLGQIRELDVLLQLTGQLRAARHHDRALGQVETEIRRAREKVRRDLPAKQIASGLERAVHKVGQAADAARRHHPDRAWRWALDARVARRAATVQRAVEGAGALYLPDRLHEVRIAIKKLRYALELSRDAETKTTRADLARLKRVQVVLGDINNRQMLIEWVRGVQASVLPGDSAVVQGLSRLVTSLDGDCRRLHARYVRGRSGVLELCRRLSARTSSGRAMKKAS